MTGCNDVESQQECLRAEGELTDWVNSIMDYARTMTVHRRNMSTQDGINHAVLSYSLEKFRPVPDCSNGLFTTTPLTDLNLTDDGNLYDYYSQVSCYSPEMLAGCDQVKNGASAYKKSIMMQLRKGKVSKEFIDLMTISIEGPNTLDITCKTTDHHYIASRRKLQPILGYIHTWQLVIEIYGLRILYWLIVIIGLSYYRS